MNYLESAKEIENWAKEFWEENNVSKVELDLNKEKEVVLDFFPYPSGVGLHIGHTLGYIATDIYARFKKLQGKNVLYAMGFDSFGLPAEQFAIETGLHPEIVVKENIANMKKQLALLGLNHDNDRTFSTTDPDYYKWTQWIFLKLYNSYFDEDKNKAMPINNLYEKLKAQGFSKEEIRVQLDKERLAFIDDVEVNWCPALATVLSNEEIIGGKSERGSHPVFKKKLKQWVLRITKYSQRLLDNLDALDWPISVKEMQKNWIGLSNGWEINFNINLDELQIFTLQIFTTKPETLEGATFLAVSIDHKLAKEFCLSEESKKLYEKYKNDDSWDSVDLKGFNTGSFAIHPLTHEKLPIYIANYVLNYGSGAVMSVPFHDLRDNKFAKLFNLPIRQVMNGQYEYTESIDGKSINEIISSLESKSIIHKKTNTRLKDWIFSRQRYWGEPFPIIFDKNDNIFALEDSALPVVLPEVDFKKIYEKDDSNQITKPLDKAHDWKNVNFVKLDDFTARIVDGKIGESINIEGKKYVVEAGIRETNTMPNWAGSCWYYLRYMDANNDKNFVAADKEAYWGKPADDKIGALDLYLGGAEHAVLHLLYARFWHMVLYDLEYVSSREPFHRLFNQGMIQGAAYKNEVGKYFSPSDVVKKGEEYFSISSDEKLEESIGKIGKRYKNGVLPEEVCSLYSVDSLRLYMMYLGPLEQSKPWNYNSIKGMSRLLDKIFNLKISTQTISTEVEYNFYKMLEKIQSDCQNLKFNTAIAAYIIFINSIEFVNKDLYLKLLIVFAPFAPHLCEYLFNKHFDAKSSIFNEKWPDIIEVKQEKKAINVVITVNGKKKELKEFAASSEDVIFNDYAKLFASENNIAFKKIVLVKDSANLVKLINIVV